MDQKLTLIVLSLGVSVLTSFAKEVKTGGDTTLFEQCDSKFLSESECQKWVEEMRASLPMATQELCPFGLKQAIGLEKEQVVEAKRDLAFAKAINKIPITIVNPGEGKFIVRANEFSKGDIIPIHSEGKKFKAEIVAVKGNGIVFKNIKTGEKVSKNLAKPEVFDRKNRLDKTPGVMLNNPNLSSPIILDDN